MFRGDRYVEIARALQPDEFDTKTFHTTFIVKKGRIQKIGINSTKTHPRNLRYRYVGKEGKDIRTMIGVHSELNAIIRYGREDCSDCTFVNVRIDKNGNVAIAAPCKGCQNVLRQVGFKQVFYTNDAGVFEEWS